MQWRHRRWGFIGFEVYAYMVGVTDDGANWNLGNINSIRSLLFVIQKRPHHTYGHALHKNTYFLRKFVEKAEMEYNYSLFSLNRFKYDLKAYE